MLNPSFCLSPENQDPDSIANTVLLLSDVRPEPVKVCLARHKRPDSSVVKSLGEVVSRRIAPDVVGCLPHGSHI